MSPMKMTRVFKPYEAIATAVGGLWALAILPAATAVTGGPGAVLWIWLTAFMGMLIKQVEVTLAVWPPYRRGGNPYGGPTYYMEYGLGERHWGRNGFRWLLCLASASFPFYQCLQLYHIGSAGPVLWNSPGLASCC